MQYSNDPFPLITRFRSKCAGCGCSLPKGTNIYYWPRTKRAYCLSCGDADYRRFQESAQEEEFYAQSIR